MQDEQHHHDHHQMKPLEVDVDAIMKEVGTFGKYQMWTFFWLLFPIVMTSWHANNFIFSAQDTEYRCKVPTCDDDIIEFKPNWSENAIPPKTKCHMYAMINVTHPSNFCPAEIFDKSKLAECSEYVFRYEDSFVEEIGIACEDWKRTLIGTIHNFGTLICLVFIGFISDRFGRRSALILSCMLEGGVGMIKAFSVNYPMYLTFELMEPSLGSGVYSAGYILGLEYLLPSTRVLGGCYINILFALGQVTMGLLAWAFQYWRTYILVIYVPTLLNIILYWTLQESPRWLLSKRRYQDVIDNLNKAAEINGKTIPEKVLGELRFNAENASKFDYEAGKTVEVEVKPSPYKEIMRSRLMIVRVLKCSFWWITCTFCFYGLSINAVALAGNHYINFVYTALVEIPAHMVGYYALNWFGRKKTLFVSFFVAGLSCFCFAFMPEDIVWLSLVVYLVGKFFITLAFNAVYLYTSELFPTNLRHSLLGFCSMIGRIGSSIAPQTPLLGALWESLPSLMFGIVCTIAALLMLTSPETIDLKLPETVEEAERIGKQTKSEHSSNGELQ